MAIAPQVRSPLLSQVEALSGQAIYRCNQCGKCTAGCPAALDMDLPPRRVMRALQLGLQEEVLGCSSIWVCLYCRACSARCPLEIDVDRVMEALRLLAAARRQPSPERRVALFHKAFLGVMGRRGRLYDFGLGAWYNLLTRRPWANLSRLPVFLAKGKLSLLPPKATGRKQVKALLSRGRGSPS